MKDKKFLIAVVYYERPKIFLNALNSILNCNYDNFEVHIIDDGSVNKAEPIAREVCSSIIDKFKFTYINNSIEEKKKQGGSIHGKYLTEAIRESNSEHVIVLCDDDAIYPNFLKNLNNFLNLPDNINKNYFYHNVVLYDSLKETYLDGVKNNNLSHFTNKHTEPINCNCAVDGSQVTFDREKFVNDDISYAYPQTKNLDADSFQKMFNSWGPAYYSGLISQVKCWNGDNLGAKSGDSDYITNDIKK